MEKPATPATVDMRRVEVVAPNFKRRLSGVTSTIIQLVPLQAKRIGIATLGSGLPDALPKMRLPQVVALLGRPRARPFRVWHARRNVEMVAGVILKHVFRAPLKLVFTSAAQRDHKPFTKWLIRRMDAVVATSARSGSFLDVPHRVIMHGIDTERFHPARTSEDEFAAAGLPGRFAVGCFGRIRHQKGTDLFVDAMIALLPEFLDWTAIITGRVTAEHQAFGDELRRKIEKAGLSSRIHLLGEVPSVDQWYRRLSLYVAPSRNEGFGLTPLEAMASGVPVVTSDAGAYRELIEEGVTGSVVPAGDGAALTEAIRKYMGAPHLAREAGRRSIEHVRTRFALEREADALIGLYEGLFDDAMDGGKPA